MKPPLVAASTALLPVDDPRQAPIDGLVAFRPARFWFRFGNGKICRARVAPAETERLSSSSGVAADGIQLAVDTRAAVAAALADDLNTPLAVASLSAPLKTLNDLTSTKKGKKAAGRDVALADLVLAVEDVA